MDATTISEAAPSPARRTWIPMAVAGAIVTVIICGAVYLGYRAWDSQREELSVLVHELAVATQERDAQRTRAEQAERQAADLSTRLSEVTIQLTLASDEIGRLALDLESATSTIARLEEEAGVLRSRIASVQSDARGATADAQAAREAQARESRVSSAALAYANASDALSSTRNRMLNLCNDSMGAVIQGRYSSAISLEREYNLLVPTHNRQVTEVNTALARLRAALG